MSLKGKIIKILANFYYVQDIENKVWECFARGRLLKEGKLLFVGDEVVIETSTSTQGVIVNLLNRKNKISKPPIANIDQVLVVFSVHEPDFDFYNLDRYLSYTLYELPDEKIIICLNKTDLGKLDISENYKNTDFKIFGVSALKKDGMDILANELINKTTVLAGPSGVGKSSLIKVLAPNEDIKIGDLTSIKLGRHTTRNVQLISINYNKKNGFLVDTPGFSNFSFAGLKQNKLLNSFKEFKSLDCSFRNCMHTGGEGCSLNESNKSDIIHPVRYENYLKILDELQSEIIYGTKEESKTKLIGNKLSNSGKKTVIPKIDQDLRKKSRKKEKQDLQKIQKETGNY